MRWPDPSGPPPSLPAVRSTSKGIGAGDIVLVDKKGRRFHALVTELVERDAVAVHPGYFFDFAHEAFLVVSLLPEPGEFARGVRLVQERLDAA